MHCGTGTTPNLTKENQNETQANEKTFFPTCLPEWRSQKALEKQLQRIQHAGWDSPLMACYHPITLPIKQKPYRPGMRAFWVERTVPCGSCIGCRSNQAREWSMRILHEQQQHLASWFLTLTYSDENLPDYGSLYPEHLRRFFKTLRKILPEKSLSYYACGEYGERTKRPHYHAVLFGPDFLDKYRNNSDNSNPTWCSPTLGNHWPYGLHEFSTVTPASASYVAGYVRKKLNARQQPNAFVRVDEYTGELHDVTAEFSRMSLRPAIGKRWIEKHWKDVYPRDFVVMQGKEYKPPRYYDKWMEKHHPAIMAEVRFRRDHDARHIEKDQLAKKEKTHKARSALYESRGKI